jgi:heat shock protein HtpX
MSRIKTGILIALLTALLCAVGYGLAGTIGMFTAFVCALCIHIGIYRWGDVIVLRLYGAQELDDANEPELFVIVQALTELVHVPMPRIYIIPEPAPNACVVGRSSEHAALAVTSGLLDVLDSAELASVIAHELAHIKYRDILVMTVVATLTGTLSTLVDVDTWRTLYGRRRRMNTQKSQYGFSSFVGYLVAPLLAALVQLTISRVQDFYADDMSARLTGEPQVLANALSKLERWNRFTPMQIGSPATAHLFIINPFSEGTWAQLFGTHPTTSDRIAYLEALTRLQNGEI